jgi:hypothetical protein
VLTDLQTDATRRPARVRRNPATSHFMSVPPRLPRPLLTRDPQQSALVRHLRKLLRRSSRTGPPLDNQPCDPLDVCLLSCFCGNSFDICPKVPSSISTSGGISEALTSCSAVYRRRPFRSRQGGMLSYSVCYSGSLTFRLVAQCRSWSSQRWRRLGAR